MGSTFGDLCRLHFISFSSRYEIYCMIQITKELAQGKSEKNVSNLQIITSNSTFSQSNTQIMNIYPIRVHTCPANQAMPPINSYIEYLRRQQSSRQRTQRNRKERLLKLHQSWQQYQQSQDTHLARQRSPECFPPNIACNSPLSKKRRYEQYQQSVKQRHRRRIYKLHTEQSKTPLVAPNIKSMEFQGTIEMHSSNQLPVPQPIVLTRPRKYIIRLRDNEEKGLIGHQKQLRSRSKDHPHREYKSRSSVHVRDQNRKSKARVNDILPWQMSDDLV